MESQNSQYISESQKVQENQWLRRKKKSLPHLTIKKKNKKKRKKTNNKVTDRIKQARLSLTLTPNGIGERDGKKENGKVIISATMQQFPA